MKQSDNTVISNATSSTISPPTQSENLFYCSVQSISAGSVGTITIQCSNDNPTSGSPTNWSPIPGATVSVTGSGVFLIPTTQICYEWIRVVYSYSSGSGPVSVNLKTQGE